VRYDAIRQGRCGLAADGMAGRCKARIGLVRQGPARQVGHVEVEQDLASLGLARRVGMRLGMAGGSRLVTVYSGLFRHGLARLGEDGQGEAGQVGSGKARRVAFFWDWVRQGRCVGACWVQA
jgi:hypothetical protein